MSKFTIRLLLLIGLFTGFVHHARPVAAQKKQEKPVSAPTGSSRYDRHEYTSADGDKLSYWLMTPEEVKPGEKYPLVLALHGRGGNTTAAGALSTPEMRKKYPCFVLAPAVSRAQIWALPDNFRKLPGPELLPVALEVLDTVVKDQPIDATRLYVTGQSMGGFGSFGAVALRPELFAAAMPVCGGWDAAQADKLAKTPFWIFHGEADKTVPVERSRSIVEAIKKAGGQPEYTEYPGVGHNSWTKTYDDPAVWKWLFAQQRKP